MFLSISLTLSKRYKEEATTKNGGFYHEMEFVSLLRRIAQNGFFW
jgi:hypothetical protein